MSAIFTHSVEAQGALHGKAVHGNLLAALGAANVREADMITDRVRVYHGPNGGAMSNPLNPLPKSADSYFRR